MNPAYHTAHRISLTIFSFLFFTFCLLLPHTLFAQNIETTPHIEVIGSAQMEVIPNEVNVQITLREHFDGKFKITIFEQEMKMKNMFKIAGVDLTKLNLANVNADYVTVTKKNKNITAERIYILTVSTVPMLTSSFQVLNDLNIKEARVISATHSQMDSLRQVVRIKALQDAKAKAGASLRAIGNRLGKPLIIKEIDFLPFENDVILAKHIDVSNLAKTKEDIIEDEYVLEFKKIKIQSSVFARFAIE